MRKKLMILATVVATLMLLTFGLLLFSRSMVVTITNSDTTVLHGVVLHVTGNSYPVGDIKPKEMKQVIVQPKGESSIVLESLDFSGNRNRRSVDCYIEPGFTGSIAIEIKQGKVRITNEDITLY